ncbi:12613_t:CDS:2 [Acaulospora colombiana]|uniref:12613_t:CDS:1 n=1 Tax=Acaulospora colombiana TaxID=27376 RepID=A0ACA9LUU2_9GLOM|nr:12613_t:CDS:2 [Acaulospora colombiana]
MDTLPVELIRSILQNLKPSFSPPTLARDAVWDERDAIPNWWSREHLRHQKRRSIYEELSDFEEELPSANHDPTVHYRTLLPLRLVNRFFNEVFTAFVYQELNLFDPEEETADDEIVRKYGEHITIIRARLVVNGNGSDEMRLTRILSLCGNVQSLGLYYDRTVTTPQSFTQTSLAAEIMSCIENKRLRSLGFYSDLSRVHPGGDISTNDQDLFYEIAKSNQAKLIKRLDVYFDSIPSTVYTLLRTRFTGLEALDIRETFAREVGPIWVEGSKEPFWATYANLTTLKMIGWHNVYPPLIAKLICHFPAIEHFMISACGDPSPAVPHGRSKGWSFHPDGWWNQRRPLKSIHMEHMILWEILAMGTIPTLEMTAVGLRAAHLAKAFIEDNEIFPHLRLLRKESSKRWEHVLGGAAVKYEQDMDPGLLKVCDSRGIELHRDGSWIVHVDYGWCGTHPTNSSKSRAQHYLTNGREGCHLEGTGADSKLVSFSWRTDIVNKSHTNRVNRLFNDICTPFVYQEINLFDLDDEHTEHIAASYGKYVKIIRARIVANAPQPYERRLVNVLFLCENVQSLSLYYRRVLQAIDPGFSSSPLLQRILASIKGGKLLSLGFYSPNSYNSPGENLDARDQGLLYGIAMSDQAKSIKRLDLYFRSMALDLYILIRTRFIALEALTFRNSLEPRIGPIWTLPQYNEPYWTSYSNLTSLQLIGCSNIYPPHIPELVRHFTSLEYFLISACGDPSPSLQHERSKGWSSQSDGWWNQRKPLKAMHIEHMLTWEILVMGTIPVLEITATSLHAAHLANTFLGDNEIFPHLQLLHAEPLESKAFDGYERFLVEGKSETELKMVCDARKIEFRRDATWLIHHRYGWW